MATGDITYSNAGGESADKAFASGIYVLDISEDTNIICGFQPSKVVLNLKDAGATAHAIVTWIKGMTAGDYQLISDGGDITYDVDYGPIVYSGTAGEGFTIPSDLVTTDLSAADDDIMYWEAWR